jgi:peptide/nickel transport system permease protein
MTLALSWRRNSGGIVGIAIVGLVLLIVVFGPLLAPHAPNTTIGIPGAGPGPGSPLGTDSLGRDVLSRILCGGTSLMGVALAGTATAALLGTAVGLVAGYSRSIVDPILMRSVDVVLVFPPLLFFIVLVTAVGTSPLVVILGIATVLAPGTARLVHTLTRETSVAGYVEAAVARGERTSAVLWREILPNILGPLLAQVGLTLTFSILIAASVNFLGMGVQPPKADWGVMIAENREILSGNPAALVVPAVLIALLTVGVNSITDGLRRALGPEGGS